MQDLSGHAEGQQDPEGPEALALLACGVNVGVRGFRDPTGLSFRKGLGPDKNRSAVYSGPQNINA